MKARIHTNNVMCSLCGSLSSRHLANIWLKQTRAQYSKHESQISLLLISRQILEADISMHLARNELSRSNLYLKKSRRQTDYSFEIFHFKVTGDSISNSYFIVCIRSRCGSCLRYGKQVFALGSM